MIIKTLSFFLFLLTFVSIGLLSQFIHITWNWWSCVYYTIFSLAVASFTSFAFNQFISIIKIRGCSPRVLFYNFGEKIWMTFFLGSFFICLFIFINVLISFFIDKESFLRYFFYGLEHPEVFIFWTTSFFALNTIFILIIREIIKFFYLSRKH
jgi:hypothetical protein